MAPILPSKRWSISNRNKDRDSREQWAALDLLTTAVIFLNLAGEVEYVNTAAQDLLELSILQLFGNPLSPHFQNSHELEQLLSEACADKYTARRLLFTFQRHGRSDGLVVLLNLSYVQQEKGGLLLEFVTAEQQLRIDREERTLEQSQANKELIRNLAHEIKNPLGGIRGAAQLLEAELENPDLHEYTQVIIKESDRLQSLVDRLLAPHRKARIVEDVNIHEVCERVRSVLLAEYPRGLQIQRDYDTSIPDFRGDKEQLIQAVLNIAHNAAQALHEKIKNPPDNERARITLRTRIARQMTIAKQRYRLALELHVIDNGPGIASEIHDKIFLPLVSGRDGGSGLGLTLAQTFVQQHEGLVEFVSEPGMTDFRIVIPLP